MTRPRIALLNAAHEAEGNRRNFRRELAADLTEFHLPAGDIPETYDFDGVVVTGSRASVYWDEEWIDPTKEWVEAAIDRGLPCLGVCYGHQLLADVLGGTVESMGEYEIGYRTVERAGDSRLLAGLDEEFTVFTTHSDAVVELPPGAERLATNEYGVHGFRKDRVFGVQFHPEYDVQTAEEVTKGKDLPEERIRSVLDGITPENFDAACEAKQVFDNFVDFVGEVDVHGANAASIDDAAGDDAVAADD
ncbi:type 1 glutamine amidotransferase [Halosimplex sp. J119]